MSKQKLKMHIFLFEKNEIDILKEWIEYHATIVDGYKNISIIDHKSKDGSLNLLETYKKLGLNVIKYDGPYKNKGKVMTLEMKKYKNYDLLIPLDADEFIVTHRNGQLTKNVKHVLIDLSYVANLKNIGSIKFGKIYNLINTQLDPKLTDLKHFEIKDFSLPTKSLPKSIFSGKNFVSTDMGNHIGSISTSSRSIVAKNLALLHFQVRGIKQFTSKTNKSITAFGYKSKNPTLNIGKHWKNDYDLTKKHGATEAFIHKYLITDKERINKATVYNFFDNTTTVMSTPSSTPRSTPRSTEETKVTINLSDLCERCQIRVKAKLEMT